MHHVYAGSILKQQACSPQHVLVGPQADRHDTTGPALSVPAPDVRRRVIDRASLTNIRAQKCCAMRSVARRDSTTASTAWSRRCPSDIARPRRPRRGGRSHGRRPSVAHQSCGHRWTTIMTCNRRGWAKALQSSRWAHRINVPTEMRMTMKL